MRTLVNLEMLTVSGGETLRDHVTGLGAARTLPIESLSSINSFLEFALTYGDIPNSAQIRSGTSKTDDARI